jgi:hypothetical protein
MIDRSFLEELKVLDKEACDPPWEHNCDEDPPQPDIDGQNGLVAFVQPHGNIHTVLSTGESFCHADAKLIVLLRNNVSGIIQLANKLEEYDCLLTKIRILLDQVKIPDWEPYSDELVSDHEVSLRKAGRVIPLEKRLEILIDKLRKEDKL